MTNIYLDIDGVILANDKQQARFADQFIKHVVTNYRVYWLTTHCRKNFNETIPLLSSFFVGETLDYLKKIVPTEWEVNKTEAIDFSSPFLWFDDDLYDGERQDLLKYNVLENWIQVDLGKNQNHLGVILTSFPIPIDYLR
jgi:hypothetical protein